MKIPAGDFEAALRQKRQATGEPSRPLKRIRQGGPSRPAPTPAEAPVDRKPVVRVAPRPAGADAEEGEIPATTEPTVVVLDEEEVPAAAEVPEAGQVTEAINPPAAAGPEGRGAPPTADEGEQVAGKAREGAKATGKQGGESRGSPRHKAQRPDRPRAEGPQKGLTRPVPIIGTMADAAQASRLLSGVRTTDFADEMRKMSRAALIDMTMVSVVQMANGILGLRDALSQASDSTVQARARAEQYRKESEAHAESLARLRRESSAREESWDARLKEAESRGRLAAEKLKVAAARNKELTEQLHLIEERAHSAARQAALAEKSAAEATQETARVAARAEEIKAQAEAAAGKAREAEARAEEAEAKAQRAASEAERAVQDYKVSPAFKQEVIEASLDAYIQGFEMCKVKVSGALGVNPTDLEDIRPGGSDEEPPEPAGEPANKEQPGPSEP